MVEREAEALRDGEQAARERHQAQMEMEQGLIAQEQWMERDTGVPIYEQADLSDNATDDGENVITATHAGGSDSTDSMGGSTIGSPGAGTDPSETQTSSGELGRDTVQGQLDATDEVEFSGDERTFEGDGRHALEDQ
ncbi:MAG: hypothetical protein JWM86_1290 [Thermoleophilia bacterium]|nr:hypothetical protein [Thermoleophilia bacterium]